MSERRCFYFSNTLQDLGVVIIHRTVKGHRNRSYLYGLPDATQKQISEAGATHIHLTNNANLSQISLDSIELKWVEELIANLRKRRLIEVDRSDIISESIKQNGGYDERLAIAAVKTVRKAGIEVS
jgi:hypothetical protein